MLAEGIPNRFAMERMGHTLLHRLRNIDQHLWPRLKWLDQAA
jgi:hypothetical protein